MASPFEGVARLYSADGNLRHTFNLARVGVPSPATSPEHQLYPCAAQTPPSFQIDAGGWIEANVPIYVVQNVLQNNPNGEDFNGTEITLIGTTPQEIRAEIRMDANGLLRRREIDASGQESWIVC